MHKNRKKYYGKMWKMYNEDDIIPINQHDGGMSMSKWRKAGTIGLIAVMICVSGAGCKKKATPERLFQDMAKNGEKIKSISGGLEANMEISAGDQTAEVKMDFDLASTEKPEAFQMEGKISMNIAGTDVSMDMSNYQLEEDGEAVSYMYVNGMWAKETVEEEEEETALSADMVERLIKQSEAFTLSEELVTVNEKECFELKGDIGGEFAADMLGEDMLETFGMGGAVSKEDIKNLEIPCTITVYKDDILPASISIDMKDVLTKAMEEAEGMEIQELNLEMNFDEYNKVKEIKLPKGAKEQAIDAGGGISGLLEGDMEEDMEEDVEKEDTDDVDDEKPEEPSIWESLELNVGGKTVTLPCKVSELEAAGLKIDAEEIPADQMVKPGETEFPMLKDKNGNQVGVYCENTGDADAKVTDCTLIGFYITSRDGEGIVDIALPGDVRLGTTEAELLEKYGEPGEKSEDTETGILTYSWEDELFTRSLEIELDKDSKQVISIMIDIWDY